MITNSEIWFSVIIINLKIQFELLKTSYIILLLFLLTLSSTVCSQTALDYMNSGKTKLEKQDYRGAISDITRAIEIDPQNATAYGMRGGAKGNLKDNRGAISDLTKAIDLEPENPILYLARGSMKIEIEEYSGAISDYNKVIELDPKKALAYLGKGAAKFALKDNEDAIRNLNRGLELRPNYPRGYYLRGLAKCELGQKESGCSDLKKAVGLGYSDANEAIKKYCTNLPVKQQSGSEKISNSTPIRSFKASGKVFDIPIDKVKLFLIDMPEAKEVKSFLVGKDTLNIPIDRVTDFFKYIPEKKLTPIIQNGRNLIVINESIYNLWLHATHEGKMKLLYYFILTKNPQLNNFGYEVYVSDMKDEENLSKLYISLSKRHSEWLTIGCESFKKEMLNNGINKDLSAKTSNNYDSVSSFQIDKIKVGDTFIDLPIPNGFVKVDSTMFRLTELAKKFCATDVTLLSFFISEKDYANYLVDNNCQIKEYIFIEVPNSTKFSHTSNKDFRQIITSFKKHSIDEFKKQSGNLEQRLSDSISTIAENLKLKNLKIQPLGIYYESKNSISAGILSKSNLEFENVSSDDCLMIGISTITKIKDKPIMLLIYKSFTNYEDISSLKALNTAWIKEVDKKQSPVSFIADIDFEDYKEAILAILTLSFIWAIYFATKKIHKKIKEKAVKEEIEVVEKNNLFDFDELLKEVGTIPNDLAYNEEISGETLQETEEIIAEPTTVRNPELLKVGRRMRLLHFLIDMLFLYFIAFCSGYVLVFIFGQSKALKIVEHTYLYVGSLAFIVYFSQEFIFGKTLGKLFTGTRVVDSLGNKPDIVKLIIRNASRLIPLEAFSFLGSNKRGWHDTISDTFVIKD